MNQIQYKRSQNMRETLRGSDRKAHELAAALRRCRFSGLPQHRSAPKDNSVQKLNFLPELVVNRFLEDHMPYLRKIVEKHSGEVKSVSAHDIFSYREYNSQ